MIALNQKEACCGCQVCAAVCPKQCICMVKDGEGFRYPQIDREQCVDCGLCNAVCPLLHKQPDQKEAVPAVYAAIHKEDAVRNASSSGGVFSALAKRILEQGGVVFGAAMSENCLSVQHIAAETEDALAALRGSKYLQSNAETAYSLVRTALVQGRQVLFSGTPCQTEALRAYLGQEYKNLLSVDFICHGVPSEKVWQEYLNWRTGGRLQSVKKVHFRDKQLGWKRYSLQVELVDGTKYSLPGDEDPFISAFLSNVCLRPSCYQCGFKKMHRQADLTMADFWGAARIKENLDDDGGVSLVAVHSERGQAALQNAADLLELTVVDGGASLARNPAMTCSAACPPTRKAFMDALGSEPFDMLVKRLAKRKRSLKQRVVTLLDYMMIGKILRKLLLHN